MQSAKEIILKAKKDVYSPNVGDNVTSFRGDGIDFKEIKEYAYGDDVKKINWKATAKSGEVKVNVFNESRQLNVLASYMLSGSMHFGSRKLKSEVATEIMALLGFSATLHNDMFLPIFFSDKIESFYEPSVNDDSVYRAVEDSLGLNLLEKKADYEEFSEYINSVVRKRSMIFVISDFYDVVNLSEIAYENDVYAIIVRDRIEEYPKLNGNFNLINPNTLDESEFYLNKGVADEYSRLLNAHDAKLKEHFLKHKITFGKIYTDDDIYMKLSSIIKGS